MRLPGGRSASLSALLTAVACGGASEGLVEPLCAAPVVSRAEAVADSTNVLRAFVSGTVQGTDSVVVRFGFGSTRDSTTPAFVPVGGAVVAPILGLESGRRYETQLIAYNGCGTTASSVLAFDTGPLPADLPSYSGGGELPKPGYLVIGAGSYGLVLNSALRVVWYHRFPAGLGLNFQAQPNGRYVARPPSAAGQPGAWVEIAPTGEVTRTLGCARGLQPRMHDMIAEPGGGYWVLCDETRTMDLSAQGASAQSRVSGTSVQHIGAAGELLFDWSPFDHFAVELNILDAADRNAAVINWTHGNALDLDVDGNLIVSFRNLSEVTKIDTRTGAVLWRLGGVHNQFTFDVADPMPFVRQHGARALGGGQLLLLDNLGQTLGSRAERYALDESRHSARLSGTYASSSGLVAQVGGSTQALANGKTLVSYGSGGGVEEYDASGRVVWRMLGNVGYVFRAQRITSLYRPGAGDPR